LFYIYLIKQHKTYNMTTFIIPTDKGNKLLNLDTDKPLDQSEMFEFFFVHCNKMFWEIDMDGKFNAWCGKSMFTGQWVLEVIGDNGVRNFDSIEEISL
jgi:hypothetical protein